MDLSSTSHCTPVPNPNPNVNSDTDPCLRAVSSSFKREKRRMRKERKRQEKLLQLLDEWTPFADQHRPVKPSPRAPSSTATEWPSEPVAVQNPDLTSWSLKPRQPSQTEIHPPAPVEDPAHQNAIKSCRLFFSFEAECGEEDWAEDYVEDNIPYACKSYHFFMMVFKEEDDARNLFQRDWEKSDFMCLVCCASGEKPGKRFIGLARLLQHANAISKTKWRIAHRSYARAICHFLGLDIQCSAIDGGDGDKHSQVALGDWVNTKNDVAQQVDVEDAGEDFLPSTHYMDK